MSEETEPKRARINWTADKIMSTSAVVIALISLIALFYQLSLAREENELIRKQQSASVLPHLNQWFSSVEGFIIVFGNKGVGPAFITGTQFFLNDSLRFTNSDHLFKEIVKKVPALDNYAIITSTFHSGTVLPANETIEIIYIKDPKAIELFNTFFTSNKIKFKITYSDVYGTQWSLSNMEGSNTPQLIESSK